MSNDSQEIHERSNVRPPRQNDRSPRKRRLDAKIAVPLLLFFFLLATVGAFFLNRGFADENVAPPSADAAFSANGASSDASSNSENAVGSSVSLESASKNVSIPVKWLPDLKVLKGAPATTISLDAALSQLCAEKYFGADDYSGKPASEISPNDLNLSVLSGDGDVATATFATDGRTLCVNWVPEAVGETKFLVKCALKADETRAAYISFGAESWTPNYWAVAATVLGGLGLFLLGMKMTSDGLQAIAGARLRRLISLFTTNRFLAVGVGFLVTTIIQSSSATTVIVIGFVNSGLMTLAQAIGVIMGSNIGTTTTGWLLTLDVGALALPLLGIGAFFYLFVANERVRNFATFAIGIGMIFFGLKTMSSGLSPLPDVPEFTALMKTFEATSLFGAFKCVLVGCVLTVLVQSSAATIGITMTLTTIGAIEFETAAALVLGENIGTTITALLASLGAPATNAKRAAYFHTLFNVAGVCWALAVFFPILLPAVRYIGDSCDMNDVAKIALTHSLFNVTNTIVFLPLVGPVAFLLNKYVKETAPESVKRPSTTGLASFADDEPIVGIERSRLETVRMFADCRTLVDYYKTLKTDDFEDRSLIEEAFALEKKLDDAQDETIAFVSRLTARSFTSDVADAAREQVRVAEELETISDYLVGGVKSNLKLKEANLRLPTQINERFDELLGYVDETTAWLEKIYDHRGPNNALATVVAEATERRAKYVARVKEIRDEFMQTMFDEQIDPRAVVAADYQLNAWRRIYEHLHNIAEAIAPRRPQPRKKA